MVQVSILLPPQIRKQSSIMTSSRTGKLQYTLCACNSVFRGDNFKKHLKGKVVTADLERNPDSHKKVDRVCFCVHHKVFSEAGSEVFGANHTLEPDCLVMPKLSKDELSLIIRRIIPERFSGAIRVQEERLMTEQQAAVAFVEKETGTVLMAEEQLRGDLTLSSSDGTDSDSVFEVAFPPSKRLRSVVDNSNSVLNRTHVNHPLGSSSPKDNGQWEEVQGEEELRPQGVGRLWVETGTTIVSQLPTQQDRLAECPKAVGMEKAKTIAPYEVISDLRKRLHNALADRDRAVKKRDELRARTSSLKRPLTTRDSELNESKTAWEQEKSELLTRLRASEEETLRLREDLEASEGRVEVVTSKLSESERTAGLLEKRMEALHPVEKSTMIHIGCLNGTMKALHVEGSLEEGNNTTYCYDGSTAPGMCCHHVFMTQGVDGKTSVHYKNTASARLRK